MPSRRLQKKVSRGEAEGLISPTLSESVVLEAKLNRVKRANFINKSLELSQEFYFASSRSKFRIKDTYNSHFYGSPIWNLFSKPCSSLLFCFVLFCSSLLFCFVLFMWWAGNCSITESLPELIQQVRQDLAGAPGGQP